MNNKRWYILFSVLILLMLGYVVYVFANDIGELNADGISLNVSLANGSGTYRNTALVNGSKIIASVLGLNLTIFGTNLTTNGSWYFANVSDNYYIRIGNRSAANQTQYGTFDLFLNLSGDLVTRNFMNARTYNILINITNFTDFGTLGFSRNASLSNNTILKMLTLTIYPHRLNNSNASVMLDGEFTKRDGTVVGNITTQENITGIVRFNATLATNTITTNVTWKARGDYDKDGDVDEFVLGTNNSIGGTDIVYDMTNISDGYYNITLHVTNRSDFALSGSGVYDPINSFNTTILGVIVDNTAPSVSNDLSDTDAIIYTRGELKVTCGFSDPSPGSGLTPSTQVLELEKPNGEIVTALTGTDANNEQAFNEADTAATGTYKVRCSVNDGVNQNTVTEKTFQVFARGGASTGGTGGGKKVEGAEGGEAGEVEQPTGPTGAAVGEGAGAAAGPSAPSGGAGTSGSTVAVIVAIIVIAGVVVYFLVKGKPGKKGQIKFSRAELKPKN